MNIDHNCISRVRKEIMSADESIASVYFKLSTIEDMSARTGLKKTGQEIEVTSSYKKKDGTTSKKVQKSFVSHEFCPFCGLKYELDPQTPSA